ncbi:MULTISPECIES: hypothetical protein [Streptomyces]|uniref:hypothetical protein n=1 Tax=Streptomyces TaxID=1883 RepID=UPI0014165908|nr:hypothetical protein [Streptomyces sp. SID7805]MYU53144.1 hypothetical protein [Streptomyces sp. SID7805]
MPDEVQRLGSRDRVRDALPGRDDPVITDKDLGELTHAELGVTYLVRPPEGGEVDAVVKSVPVVPGHEFAMSLRNAAPFNAGSEVDTH